MKHILLLLIMISSFIESNASIEKNKLLVIDGYAAKINNVIITRSEVREEMKPFISDVYNSYSGEELELELIKIFDNTLKKMIDRELIYESFKSQGGKIPESMIEKEINNIIKKRYKNDHVIFQNYLINQNQTYQDFKEEIEKNIAITALVSQNIGVKIKISPKSIQDYYSNNLNNYFKPKKVKFSVIKTKIGDSSEESKSNKILANEILKKYNNGETFEKIINNLNNQNQTLKSYPWMLEKDIPEYIFHAIKSLKINEISAIIKNKKTYDIVYLENEIPSSYIPFESVKKEIKIRLTTIERDKHYNVWLEDLRSRNFIKIYK